MTNVIMEYKNDFQAYAYEWKFMFKFCFFDS